MFENEEISVEPDNNVNPVTDQTNTQTVETETGNNGLARAAIGGVVGAVLGTVAIAFANKKTAEGINRTVKDVGNAVKDAASGVNFSVKNAVETVKGVAKGVNETQASAASTVQATTEDINETQASAASTVQATTEDINETQNSVASTVQATTEDINETQNSVASTVQATTEDINETQNSVASIQIPVAPSQPVGEQSVEVSDTQTFQLYEERLVASKKQVKTGEVAIAKHVETHTARISIPLEKERLVIEHIPVNPETPVVPGEAEFYQRELVRMEIYEETPDIQKQSFVREQISIRKEVEHETVEVEDSIRREELDLDVQDLNILNQTKTL